MNITEVLLEDGKVLEEQVEFTPDELSMPDGQFKITHKAPFNVKAANIGDKALDVKCTGALKVLIPCARCLTDVEVQIDIDYYEKIDMTDPQKPVVLADDKSQGREAFEAFENIDFIHGYQLDVDRLVCGEALLNWPSQVLCSDSCKGLCRICGQNLNLKTCSCDRAEVDPRMAKIRDIFRMANQEE